MYIFESHHPYVLINHDNQVELSNDEGLALSSDDKSERCLNLVDDDHIHKASFCNIIVMHFITCCCKLRSVRL